MKRILFATFLITCAILLPTTTISQDKCEKEKPNYALLFTFAGLSDMKVEPFQGGIGAKWYFAKPTFVIASFGGSYRNPDPVTKRHNGILDVSARLGVDLAATCNTAVSVAAEGHWFHTSPDPVSNSYGFGGVIAGEFFVFKNVALNAEYHILADFNPITKEWGVSLAKDPLNFGLVIYF